MGTFADVLAQLRAAEITSLAPKLASMGIRDMDQLTGMTPLLDRPIPRRSTYQRADLPTVDQYANNTWNTWDSRWNLWTRLAQQWGLPPLPIMTDLVNAIGASLKQGRYRSAPQVFSMARQQHVTLVKHSSSRRSGASNVDSDHSLSRTPSPWKTWRRLLAILILDPYHPIGLMTPTTAPSPPSFAAGGCCGASKWRRPNGNTFGSRLHYLAGWRSSRFPATKPTPSGCASPDLIHACVQTASRTYARTTPSSSTSSALQRNEAPWAPRFFSPD